MKFKILIAITLYIGLYYMKVPVVVNFTQQVAATIIPLYNTIIDEWIHLSERHPLIYTSLPILLFYLMLPKYPYRSLVIALEDD